tara:strand:- start:4717 stop:4851 length:135 start_codon:yes stop_codon:yes gene_type:complete
MKIKFEAELDTKEDDEIGLLLVELLQKIKNRIDTLEEDDWDDEN